MLLADRIVHVLGAYWGPVTERTGKVYATEEQKRQRLGREGSLPGERSVGRAERKEAARKGSRLRRRRLLPGETWQRDGFTFQGGVRGRVVSWLVTRQRVRAEQRAERKAAERAPDPPARRESKVERDQRIRAAARQRRAAQDWRDAQYRRQAAEERATGAAPMFSNPIDLNAATGPPKPRT